MKKWLWIVVVLPLLTISPVMATNPETDCVIRDFQSTFALKTDAKLDVVENLTVDCGTLPNKHGIFRTLPTVVSRPAGVFNKTKFSNISITDNNGSPKQYETVNDRVNSTVSWKIGDPNATISGVNQYKIAYTVNNATYDQDGKTFFNWNLSGNFWQLPIDNFAAILTLPDSVEAGDSKISLFDGVQGSSKNSYSKYAVLDSHRISVSSLKAFNPGVGVTLNLTMPSGLITPYQPSNLEKYSNYYWSLLPILAFVLLFWLWSRKGRDPKIHAPEMVQYEPPRAFSPLEAGLLESMGKVKPDYITATVINLAVQGCIKITEVPGGFLKRKDYELSLQRYDATKLKSYETTILTQLFTTLKPGQTVKISGQRNQFYEIIEDVAAAGREVLNGQGLLDKAGSTWKIALMILAAVVAYAGVQLFAENDQSPSWALILTGLVIFIFALLMDRRTVEGAKAYWELRGFKQYIKKVDKHRMKFYEQENIFEKYLPYAVAFGLTSKWIKACRRLYAAQNLPMVMPLWYVGGADFNVSNVDSAISSLSSQMGSSLASSPSSSGGGGFSGGGGGGGGGGSW